MGAGPCGSGPPEGWLCPLAWPGGGAHSFGRRHRLFSLPCEQPSRGSCPDASHSGAHIKGEPHTQTPTLVRDSSFLFCPFPANLPKKPKTRKAALFHTRFPVVLAQLRAPCALLSARGVPTPGLPCTCPPSGAVTCPVLTCPAVCWGRCNTSATNQAAYSALQAGSPRRRCRRTFLLRPRGRACPSLSPGSGVGLCWLLAPSPDLPLRPHVACPPVCVSLSTPALYKDPPCSTGTSS